MRSVLLSFVVVVVVAGLGCKRHERPKQQHAAATAAAVLPMRPVSAPAPAHRAPSRPSLPAATHPPTTFAWWFAQASGTAEAWETAAASFEAQLANCTHDCVDTAYAAMLARRNALMVDPVEPPAESETVKELPERVEAVVDSIDKYVALGDPTDPDVVGARFLAASFTFRYHQDDEAIDRLEAILREHRDLDVAEYAANELLDILMRLERTEELRTWALELLADETFMKGKDNLRATLERIVAVTAPGATP